MIYLITVPFNEKPYVTELPKEEKYNYHAFEQLIADKRANNVACFFVDSTEELLVFLGNCNDLYFNYETKQEIKKSITNFIVKKIEGKV